MHLATGRGLRDLIAYFKTCRSRSPRGSLAAIQKARISAADLRGKVRQALVLPASGWKPEASARDSSARCSGSRLTESLLAQSLADASGFLVRSALICGDFDRECALSGDFPPGVRCATPGFEIAPRCGAGEPHRGCSFAIVSALRRRFRKAAQVIIHTQPRQERLPPPLASLPGERKPTRPVGQNPQPNHPSSRQTPSPKPSTSQPTG